jgi:branched-chain amino acid transport system substrate-binding protein
MRHFKKISCLLAMAFIALWSVSGSAAEIVIGFSGPLSGPAGEYGLDCVSGIEMAIKELNAAGGVTADGQKYTFRLEKIDDKASFFLAQANARKLLEKNALAIFVPVFSSAIPMLKMNQEECGEFIVMGYTSSHKATKIKNDLFVLFAPLFLAEAQVFAEQAWEKGWRKVAMVVTQGAYGDEWRETFKTYWETLGGAITADKPANYYTRTDFVGPLTAAIATNPDGILIGGPTGTTALVIEQARKMGYKGGFMIVDQAKMDGIAQLLDGTKLMENSMGVTTLAAIPAPATNTFIKRYQAAYQRAANTESALHYTGMHLLAKAIATAETQDNVYAVRAAFPKALPLLADQHMLEMHSISNGGLVHVGTGIQQVKEGKFQKADVLLWWTNKPEELAHIAKTTKYTIPMKPYKLKIAPLD